MDEWIFWIFGTPKRPEPERLTKVCVRKDEVVFETAPPIQVRLSDISRCEMTRSSSGYSYNLGIVMQLSPPHPRLGAKAFFVLADPLLAMWGNDRPSAVEYVAFTDLIASLKERGSSDIEKNPFKRGYLAKGIGVPAANIPDASTRPTLRPPPNRLLGYAIMFGIMGLLFLLALSTLHR